MVAKETFLAYVDRLYKEIAADKAEIERLRAALKDAIECVENWASYASDYFQDKHDLAGDLSRLRAALGPALAVTDEHKPGT